MDKRWVATKPGGPEALELQEHELPPPASGEVTIEVRAAGVNPVDLKAVSRLTAESPLPHPVGNELAGVITAMGPDAQLASGAGAIGDEVVAFRAAGSHATRVNVRGADVFAKPASIPMDEAAGLLLVSTTAAEMLHRVGAREGETVLLHGASGAVGVSLLQQARRLGVRVIGTTSDAHADAVREFGGVPTPYGPGLLDRVRELAPEGIAAALDAAGTDEAFDVSLELVADRSRILTIVRADVAEREGLLHIGGGKPDSAAFRDAIRAELIELAAARDLVVPIARTFALEQGREALELVLAGRAGGKVVLHP